MERDRNLRAPCLRKGLSHYDGHEYLTNLLPGGPWEGFQTPSFPVADQPQPASWRI